MGLLYSSRARGAAAAAPRLRELGEADRCRGFRALDTAGFGLEGDLDLHLERAVLAVPAAGERELQQCRVLGFAERPRAPAQPGAAARDAARAERLHGDVRGAA